MVHIDLFSGIGGFSLAVDNVFDAKKVEHIFVEIEPFCQAVLRKHWPEAEIIGDIRSFAHAKSLDDRGNAREVSSANEWQTEERQKERTAESGSASGERPFILTGGFPCQPFSQAGRRRGTEDDRHLWPQMLRVIRATKPRWVVAENVRGLLTIGGGVVFEQVCADLEGAGYEVQPLVIPAVAVNAPHRRDRVWFIAHRTSTGTGSNDTRVRKESIGNNRRKETDATNTRQQHGIDGRDEGMEKSATKRTSRVADAERCSEDVANPKRERHTRDFTKKGQDAGHSGRSQQTGWNRNWLEVATRLCRVDDGVSRELDKARLIDYIVNHGQPDQSKTAKTLSATDSSDTMRIMRLYIKVAEASLQGTSSMEKGTDSMSKMPHRGRTRQRDMGARKQKENQVCDMQPMVSTETHGEKQDVLEELPIGIGEAKRYVAVASQRNPRIKALGNAIVPRVAEEILRAIKLCR